MINFALLSSSFWKSSWRYISLDFTIANAVVCTKKYIYIYFITCNCLIHFFSKTCKSLVILRHIKQAATSQWPKVANQKFLWYFRNMKSPMFEGYHQKRKKTKPNKNRNCWQGQSAGYLPAKGYGLKAWEWCFKVLQVFPLHSLLKLHPLGSLPGHGSVQREGRPCLAGLWMAERQVNPNPMASTQPHNSSLPQKISGGRFITRKLLLKRVRGCQSF